MNSDIHILIVDDEDSFRNNLKKLLTINNFQVETASKIEETFYILRKTEIDVVILDLKLDGTSGLEILKQIKDDKYDVEVIILSGHASLNYATEIMKYGAYDYLLKPCPIAEVIDKISLAYDRKSEKKLKT